jgi:hypothetical protein
VPSQQLQVQLRTQHSVDSINYIRDKHNTDKTIVVIVVVVVSVVVVIIIIIIIIQFQNRNIPKVSANIIANKSTNKTNTYIHRQKRGNMYHLDHNNLIGATFIAMMQSEEIKLYTYTE